MKTQSEIIMELLSYLGISASKLGQEIGKNPTNIYDLINGKYRITENMANLIVTKYPDVNINFLLTGDGKVSNSPVEHAKYQKKEYNTISSLLQRIKTLESRIDALEKRIK